jgi:hypothetical protein
MRRGQVIAEFLFFGPILFLAFGFQLHFLARRVFEVKCRHDVFQTEYLRLKRSGGSAVEFHSRCGGVSFEGRFRTLQDVWEEL